MPLRPNGGIFHLPVRTKADVDALFAKGLSLSPKSGSISFQRAVTDLWDHFYYLGAVCPEHFRHLQNEAVRIPDEKLINFTFPMSVWLHLMNDAPDGCVEVLVRRLRERPGDFMLEEMLSSIWSQAAQEALLDYATTFSKFEKFELSGFALSKDGRRLQPRFSKERRAVQLKRLKSLKSCRQSKHPIGLPVGDVMADPKQEIVVWHYLTLDFSDIQGLPPVDFPKVHLVSPLINCEWTLYCRIGADGRYISADCVGTEDPEWRNDLLHDAKADGSKGRGEAALLPYDDNLIYCNGHTQMGALGDVGGPPIGLYSNPNCPGCHRLMFHVATVVNQVREFGDGFRSVFICEDCRIVACNGTSWN